LERLNSWYHDTMQPWYHDTMHGIYHSTKVRFSPWQQSN
jgi:hypothetical protein